MIPPPPFTLADAARRDFWLELCPALSIGRELPAPIARPLDLDELHARLGKEGYVQEPDVLPREFTDRLRDAIERLHARGIPAGYAFVYDEFWLVFRGFAPFLARALDPGYRVLPAFWAWRIAPSDAAAGWSAHRDRPQSLDADGTPQSLSIWLPLGDATPLNGCMYVLPAHRDIHFKLRQWAKPPPISFNAESVQDLRALPATPGSLLAWNQALLHWGARASDRGGAPRISISVEFQRSDRPAFEPGLIDPTRPPDFEARLGLIGRLFLAYAKFHKMNSPALLGLATELRDTFFRP
ncbi:MAG: hypothetical protein RLZZ15_1705 [Verrucomicrobiota bacterium]|jgi:hypothetical protein